MLVDMVIDFPIAVQRSPISGFSDVCDRRTRVDLPMYQWMKVEFLSVVKSGEEVSSRSDVDDVTLAP
jgi:hypothetical protein